MIAIVISGTVGILLAIYGFGIWALVIHYVLIQFILMVLFISVLRLRLMIKLSIKKTQVLLSFGWKLLVSSLIDTLYNDIRSLLIGKIYSSESLGFYNRGKQFPELIANNFNGTIQTVMFPVLSRHQEDTIAVKNMMRKSISLSAYILFPLMFGLFIIAEPLVLILLTDKWLDSVIFIQIFALSYSLWPIHVANLQAMNSLGRSDLYLKLEIIKKSVGFILLFISVPFGIIYIAISMLLGSIISSFINAQPNKKLLNYGYIDQIKDILPALLVSISMVVLIYPIKFLVSSNLLLLVLQISMGILVYVTISKTLKIREFHYIINTFKEFLIDRRR
jgi:O-antigen/teichoic acid export membrane protein